MTLPVTKCCNSLIFGTCPRNGSEPLCSTKQQWQASACHCCFAEPVQSTGGAYPSRPPCVASLRRSLPLLFCGASSTYYRQRKRGWPKGHPLNIIRLLKSRRGKRRRRGAACCERRTSHSRSGRADRSHRRP